MQTPLLTVIIPAFRAEEYLLRAVNSIQKQPRVDAVKIIIVDDGSPDKSGEVADRIAQQYGNVLVLHQINGGVSAARNSAISCVDTKYTAFLDADDFWEDGFLDDEIVHELAEGTVDLFQFSYRTVSPDLQRGKSTTVDSETEIYDGCGFGKYNYAHFCSVIYGNDLIRKNRIRFLPCKINEDQTFAEMCFYFALSCKKINRIFFNYWTNPASCVHTISYQSYFDEKYKSLLLEKSFFERNGYECDISFHIYLLIGEYLPKYGAFHSYRRFSEISSADSRMALLSEYRDGTIDNVSWLKNTIYGYMEHRFFLWLSCKFNVLPRLLLRSFIKSRVNSIPFLMNIYYRKQYAPII